MSLIASRQSAGSVYVTRRCRSRANDEMNRSRSASRRRSRLSSRESESIFACLSPTSCVSVTLCLKSRCSSSSSSVTVVRMRLSASSLRMARAHRARGVCEWQSGARASARWAVTKSCAALCAGERARVRPWLELFLELAQLVVEDVLELLKLLVLRLELGHSPLLVGDRVLALAHVLAKHHDHLVRVGELARERANLAIPVVERIAPDRARRGGAARQRMAGGGRRALAARARTASACPSGSPQTFCARWPPRLSI